jgi:hypothetical protein
MICLCTLPGIIFAQDTPATTPEPSDSTSPVATAEVGAPQPETAATPEAIATPEPTAQAPASPLDADALPLLINIRTDLELLASSRLGAGRPLGWSGSLDINDPQLAILMRLDLELLAGALVAPDKRPPGWFGAVPSTPLAIARDIRHDLELLADTLDKPNVRPPGWAGADPLMRCSRSAQALVNILERTGSYKLNVDPADPNFCQLVEVQAARFAEMNVLSSQATTQVVAQTGGGNPNAAAGSGVKILTNFAVAFVNRDGAQQVGIIPVNEPIKPLGRSPAQFSRMMLIEGDGFVVYIDYGASSVTQEQYEALPDATALNREITCKAKWCKSPRAAR